ncbi:MAG: zf-TFIIB domain-containing protein [Comamonadaceae bacterium]|nr:zf-TFIIB domain-containing protein [Comamonadaceae bacterium]
MKCHAAQGTLCDDVPRVSEIDYCPRGIWLDRGELKQLLDRAATATAASRCRRKPHSTTGVGLRRLGLPPRFAIRHAGARSRG